MCKSSLYRRMPDVIQNNNGILLLLVVNTSGTNLSVSNKKVIALVHALITSYLSTASHPKPGRNRSEPSTVGFTNRYFGRRRYSNTSPVVGMTAYVLDT